MADDLGQYNEMAYYYDSLMDDVDYDAWAKYIIKLINMYNVVQNDVLDMACGTGNISVRMAKSGYDVTAFDISQDMLSVASMKALESKVRINFLAQDMYDIKLDGKYGIILCSCDSINYIIDPKKLKQVFEWVYGHLKDGGIFIFDINSSYKLRKIIGENTFTYDNDDIVYIWDNHMGDDNTIEFYLTFFVKKGNLYHRFDETHIERIYEVSEIEKFLKESGFSRISKYNGFTLDGICDMSERVNFAVQK
ncbi:MAG TPA: class I SAM-dependent methyltransferase [Clostridiaceae bacterium]|nr:class I SAM-dependent methyltransferase [Clostridiaceae bacterium]